MQSLGSLAPKRTSGRGLRRCCVLTYSSSQGVSLTGFTSITRRRINKPCWLKIILRCGEADTDVLKSHMMAAASPQDMFSCCSVDMYVRRSMLSASTRQTERLVEGSQQLRVPIATRDFHLAERRSARNILTPDSGVPGVTCSRLLISSLCTGYV